MFIYSTPREGIVRVVPSLSACVFSATYLLALAGAVRGALGGATRTVRAIAAVGLGAVRRESRGPGEAVGLVAVRRESKGEGYGEVGR